MNNQYKVVWNKNRQVWQAVSECASSNGKATKAASGNKSLSLKSLLSRVAAGSLLIITLPSFVLANNLPTGGQVTAGNGQISSNGQQMTINQTSQKMVVDWQGFSIGKDASVNFVQPNAQAAALNRVLGNQVSDIRGALNANGQVFLVNPNGILFSPSARVDVGSLVASTLNITNQNFMDGNYRFEGSSGNAVINQGNIQTLNGGTVAFIAAKIINTGSITTPKGNTLMGAGNKVVLDLGGPVKIEVEASELETYIEQGGAIKADGGTVYLTTKAANALTSSVINHTGITQAQTLAAGEDGTIMLMGDMDSGLVQVAGTLDASAPTQGDGGFIETSAAQFEINKDTKIKAKTWLIDPVNIIIDDATTYENTLNGGTDIEINTVNAMGSDEGNIYINDDITWNAGSMLTLDAWNDIFINKEITATNANGKLRLSYGQKAVAAGNSSDYHVNAKVNLKAGENFITQLGSDGAETTWKVVTDAATLNSTLNNDKAKNYALGANIDLATVSTKKNWTPIGKNNDEFSGIFDGLGHTISNLNINEIWGNRIGFFGVTGTSSLIKNTYLTNIDIKGASVVGGLVGYAKGDVSNVSVEGKIEGNEYVGGVLGTSSSGDYNQFNNLQHLISNVNVTGGDYTGGLIGALAYSNLSSSHSAGSVTGSSNVGGLVGISNTAGYSNLIEKSYASATVTGNSYVGGLVGTSGFITNSYALGTVTGNSNPGGLVGSNRGAITSSYASNTVTGNSNASGLVGLNYKTITNSFYDKETNTATMSDSATYGKTKAEISASLSSVEGWSTIADGATVAGYEITLLPYLTGVTRNADKSSVTTLFAGGMGVDGDAYTITNWNQLQNINYNTDVLTGGYYFTLTNGLDTTTLGYADQASSAANTNQGWNPIGNSNKFTGTFDGNNHTVSNLHIDKPSNDSQGLFGNIDSATIKNIGVVGADIKGSYFVGGLVGYSRNSTIKNSYTTGMVTGTDREVGGLVGTIYTQSNGNSYIENSYSSAEVKGTYNIGGLVGSNNANNGTASITNSYATGKVTGTSHTIGGLVGYNNTGEEGTASITNSYATGVVSGADNVGGLVGRNQAYTQMESGTASISNSYALGSVSGTGSNVGGLVGSNFAYTETGTATASISNSYAIGEVSGTYDVGGLVGSNSAEAEWGTATASITNSFFDKDATNQTYGVGNVPYPTGVTGKTTAEMQAKSTYDGWNVTEDSSLSSDYLYPVLVTKDGVTSWKIALAGTPVSYTLSDITSGYTYNGEFQLPSDWKSSTIFSGEYTNWTLGTDYKLVYNSSEVDGFKNAGTYENISIKVLKEGYVADASSTKGKFVIAQKEVGLSTSKVYDGNVNFESGFTVKADDILSGDTVTVASGALTTASKNVGNYTSFATNTLALSNPNYKVGTTTAEITKKALSVIGITAQDKVYDGTTDVIITTGTTSLEGIIESDTVSANFDSITGAFENKNVGQNKAIAISGVTLTGADAGNYEVSSADATAEITKKDITAVNGITAENKTYDGNTDATLDTEAATFAGMIDNDVLTVATATGAFADKNAGENKIVEITNLALGGTDASNYNLTNTSASTIANIAQKALSVIGITAQDKVYDGTTDVIITTGTTSLEGIIESDTVSANFDSITGAFENKNVGQNKAIAISGVTLTGADAGNYEVSSADATAEITKKDITAVNGITAENKTYDGNTDATLDTEAATFAGMIDNDVLTVATATGAFADKNAGDGKTVSISNLALGGTDAENYNLTSTTASTTANISAAPTPTPTPTPAPAPVDPEPETPTPVEPEPETPAPVEPEPETPTPVEPEPETPAPVEPEPETPTPVEPEPVIPTPTPEPEIPAPVEPKPVVPTPTPEPEPQPTPVEPKPIAPVIKPVEQVIAGIQQQPSNVFTPNSQAGLDSANPRITTPTPSGSATPNTTTPTTATSGLLQQSGNLELVETNEANVNSMVGSGASNSALLPVFVLQGGINLGDLNNKEK